MKSNSYVSCIKKALMVSCIFDYFTDQEMQMITEIFSVKSYEDKEVILDVNAENNTLFIVGKGKVNEISADNKLIKTYNVTDAFNEMSLMNINVLASKYVAESQVEILQSDRITVTNLIKEISKKRYTKFEDYIRSVNILKDLD